ncbi:MAG: photosystem II reaction center PsbP, partial [Xenococcaceae cyanobacterium]
ALLLVLSLTFYGCSTGADSLQSYVNASKGYQFLYPNGWIPVDVRNASEGVDIVYRDLIERSENLSVIISQIDRDKNLQDLGSATDVGYRFLKRVNQNPNSDRRADLIRAESHQVNEKTYYLLEYEVDLPDRQKRHDLASVAVSHGKLYTFNLSTSDKRWGKVKNLFEMVVKSFLVT